MPATLPELNQETLQSLPSPSMIVFRDRVIQNIEAMVRMAGSAERLRPHCKTHKMPAVISLLLDYGIRKHKAATIAEVEMLASAGAPDVLLAYNPVGPNIGRVVELTRKFPDCRVSVTCDHPVPLQQLNAAAAAAEMNIPVFIDVNVGMNRTGITADSEAIRSLATEADALPHITLQGLHIYDGHLRAPELDARRDAVAEGWSAVTGFREWCTARGIALPTLVCGGTPTFPVYCEFDDPAVELSPGTSVFFDTGYGDAFPDLPFLPAAAVLTRVVSCPAPHCITLDLGTKAVASDPPKGARVLFPAEPDASQIGHNEEHLQLQFSGDHNYVPGDALLAIPVHVCPTSALYDEVPVIEGGQIVDQWTVTARCRKITV